MLTGLRQYELRVDLTDYLGKQYYAKYDSFVVDNERNKYTLHVGEYEGNAGKWHNVVWCWVWCGAVQCGAWCGMMWCCVVVWCGVVCCGVVWH